MRGKKWMAKMQICLLNSIYFNTIVNFLKKSTIIQIKFLNDRTLDTISVSIMPEKFYRVRGLWSIVGNILINRNQKGRNKATPIFR